MKFHNFVCPDSPTECKKVIEFFSRPLLADCDQTQWVWKL
jgi:hypothetical protein